MVACRKGPGIGKHGALIVTPARRRFSPRRLPSNWDGALCACRNAAKWPRCGLALIRAQGVDRIEARRAPGWQYAGQQADDDGDEFGKKYEADRRMHRQRRYEQMEYLRQTETERLTNGATERRKHDRFAE